MQWWQSGGKSFQSSLVEILAILTRRERQIKIQSNLGNRHAQRHESQVLPRAAMQAEGKGHKGSAVGGAHGGAVLAEPLGHELAGPGAPVPGVGLDELRGHKYGRVSRDVDLVDLQTLAGGRDAVAPGQQGGFQAQGLVDDVVNIGDGLDLFVGPHAAAVRREGGVELLLELAVDSRVRGQVVEDGGERGGRRLASRHDDDARVLVQGGVAGRRRRVVFVLGFYQPGYYVCGLLVGFPCLFP